MANVVEVMREVTDLVGPLIPKYDEIVEGAEEVIDKTEEAIEKFEEVRDKAKACFEQVKAKMDEFTEERDQQLEELQEAIDDLESTAVEKLENKVEECRGKVEEAISELKEKMTGLQEVIEDAQVAKGAQRRPGDGDARAVHAPLRIAVDQIDLDPDLSQPQRSGHAAHAAADDERGQSAQFLRHAMNSCGSRQGSRRQAR